MSRSLSIFDPASPQAEAIRNLAVLVLAITGFILILVEGVFIYIVVRFRDRSSSGAPEPPQFYGSKPIEIAWTAAPAMIVFILGLVTTRTLWDVSTFPPRHRTGDNALIVTVIGHQWWWEYRYEEYDGRKLGFTTANELHIPASEDGRPRPVSLTLKSADVCHSFWVPRLAGKTDLIPGRTNQMGFLTDKTGLFVGQCAEFCGSQHANMLLRVVVDPPDDFERWLANEARPAVEDTAGREGKQVFLSQSCVNCHRIRGTMARGGYAPDLTHLMGRQTLAAGMVPNTSENIRRWVDNPGSIKPGCLMPAFGLSERDCDHIAGYLLTLH
ncbi:MAG: cytochrome c oxidase subunit II [Isosphaerales bacterium]